MPLDFEVPALDRVISELRDDEQARITTGARGKRSKLEDVSAEFRAKPIEEAMEDEGSLIFAEFAFMVSLAMFVFVS